MPVSVDKRRSRGQRPNLVAWLSVRSRLAAFVRGEWHSQKTPRNVDDWTPEDIAQNFRDGFRLVYMYIYFLHGSEAAHAWFFDQELWSWQPTVVFPRILARGAMEQHGGHIEFLPVWCPMWGRRI